MFLDAITVEADAAADRGDLTGLYRLVKKTAGTRYKELKVIKWEDGSLTSSDAQYTQRFQEHFAGVFDASIVQDLSQVAVPQPHLCYLNQLPPPKAERIDQALLSLPRSKAVGPDQISAELLRAGGSAVVAKLRDLLVRVWWLAYWPFDWRGGRLQELPKKGSRRVCDNYRGLLISDHLGKASASILYDTIDEPYNKYVPQEQCGAVKRRGGDFAKHTLRTLQDYADS